MNVRIFLVLAMECKGVLAGPQFILSSERVLEVWSMICNFYLSVAAFAVVSADLFLRYTLHVAEMERNPEQTVPCSASLCVCDWMDGHERERERVEG